MYSKCEKCLLVASPIPKNMKDDQNLQKNKRVICRDRDQSSHRQRHSLIDDVRLVIHLSQKLCPYLAPLRDTVGYLSEVIPRVYLPPPLGQLQRNFTEIFDVRETISNAYLK